MIELSVDQKQLHELTKTLRAEEDGKALRKDLSKNIRQVLMPARDAARASIKAMPSRGLGASPSLRSAVAQKIGISVRMSGKATGATVKAKKTPNLRNFQNAPKRLNSKKSWRHPVYGNRNHWISQRGKPGWFDEVMRRDRAQYRQAVLDAVKAMRKRLSR